MPPEKEEENRRKNEKREEKNTIPKITHHMEAWTSLGTTHGVHAEKETQRIEGKHADSTDV